jgi:hypothetical protein
MAKGGWAQFGARYTNFAERTESRIGPPAGLPPPHGHDRRERGRYRRASWRRPARPSHLLLDTGHATWGGAIRPASQDAGSPASAMSIAKDIREAVMWQANKEDWSFLHPRQVLRTRRLHRAGRRHGRLCPRAQGTAGLFRLDRRRGRAGSRRRRIRKTYARKGHAHLKQSFSRKPGSSDTLHSPPGAAKARRVEEFRMLRNLLEPRDAIFDAPQDEGCSTTRPMSHIRPRQPRLVTRVTPQSWTFVGFERAQACRRRRACLRQTGDARPAWSSSPARARSAAGAEDLGVLGQRSSPFEGKPWSVYVPAGAAGASPRRGRSASSRSAPRPARPERCRRG